MANRKSKRRRKGYIVAIDGPSGAGKSTVSKQLAEVLGGMLLDTGGMYRSVAFFALQEKTANASRLGELARQLDFEVERDSKMLLVGGVDLGPRLRTEEVGCKASEVSQIRAIRSALTQRQRTLSRRWARHFPVVVEGRDIGTVVFPKAPFKFYVTASPQVRAKRRFAQLRKQKIRGITLKQVVRQNALRDRQDSTRRLAPLKVAHDAVVVDTSTMGISQVVKFMRDHIQGRLQLP